MAEITKYGLFNIKKWRKMVVLLNKTVYNSKWLKNDLKITVIMPKKQRAVE